ncbi:MAG: acyl-CoA dehydrogenase [Janthinobacterium lividum]
MTLLQPPERPNPPHRAANAAANAGTHDNPASAVADSALEELLKAHAAVQDFSIAHSAGLLSKLLAAGYGGIPAPGSGATLQRWRMLARVAAYDLSLVKLYEAHVDALAILAETGARRLAGEGVWAVWCAEIPHARVEIVTPAAAGAKVSVQGVKDWCSGAAVVNHALVSAWDTEGRPWLVAVDLDDDGISMEDAGWCAVGMAATGTMRVRFDTVSATCVGPSNAYLNRPGFWHGGAGIAACWYGAAAEIARCVRAKLPAPADPHRLAHLGVIDHVLSATAALLRECAETIDAFPETDAGLLALRARLQVEHCAATVMHHAGEALGAAPFCRDQHFARLMADLPVFMRQSHAQRDRAALGLLVTQAAGVGVDAQATVPAKDGKPAGDVAAFPAPGWKL